MLGDALLEVNTFISTVDQADFDEALLPQAVDQLDETLRKLFVEGMVTQIPGFTWVMVQTLAKPRTWIINGRAKTVGGDGAVAPEIITRCLRRMAAWTLLATATIAGEFPDSHLLMVFGVFKLSKGSSSTTATGEQKRLLTRVAKILKLSPENLFSEYCSYLPYAQKVFKRGNVTLFEAWKEAVFCTSTRRHTAATKAKRPNDNLVQVLARWAAWFGSSSDVERGLAAAVAVRPNNFDDTHISRDQDVLMTIDAHRNG